MPVVIEVDGSWCAPPRLPARPLSYVSPTVPRGTREEATSCRSWTSSRVRTGTGGADMRVKKLILGVTLAGTAVLTACGTGANAAQPAPAPAKSETPTTTTTTTTTTQPAPPPAAPQTTTTTKTTPKPATSKPKPKPAPPPAPAAGVPCTITDGACIDLSAKKTWLIEGGQVVYGPAAITSGRPGFRTPTGTFHVQYKDIDHKSSLFVDAPMPYSVFFNS